LKILIKKPSHSRVISFPNNSIQNTKAIYTKENLKKINSQLPPKATYPVSRYKDYIQNNKNSNGKQDNLKVVSTNYQTHSKDIISRLIKRKESSSKTYLFIQNIREQASKNKSFSKKYSDFEGYDDEVRRNTLQPITQNKSSAFSVMLSAMKKGCLKKKIGVGYKGVNIQK